MRKSSCILAVAAVAITAARADERRFGFTYEPEVQTKGVLEFEQWITLRTQRNQDVGQDNYNKWEFAEELEYGVTDRYSVSAFTFSPRTKASAIQPPGSISHNSASMGWRSRIATCS